MESLSAHIGRPLRATSYFVNDDRPGHASASNCVDVRATVNDALLLEVCGVICATVNFGEAAWVSCDLLLFASGQRVLGPSGTELVTLYLDGGNWAGGWVADEYGEWQAHRDDDRWREP